MRWFKILLPALVLVSILFADYMYSEVVLTPLLALLSLALMAFLLTPRSMLFWAVIYSGAVALALHSNILGNCDYVPPGMRLAIFIATAVFATLYCWQRSILEQAYKRLHVMFQTAPAPVLLSDISGQIVFANERAARLLQRPIDKLLFTSFFSHFSLPNKQQPLKEAYIRQFGSANTSTERTKLEMEINISKKIVQMDWLVIHQDSKMVLMSAWNIVVQEE